MAAVSSRIPSTMSRANCSSPDNASRPRRGALVVESSIAAPETRSNVGRGASWLEPEQPQAGAPMAYGLAPAGEGWCPACHPCGAKGEAQSASARTVSRVHARGGRSTIRVSQRCPVARSIRASCRSCDSFAAGIPCYPESPNLEPRPVTPTRVPLISAASERVAQCAPDAAPPVPPGGRTTNHAARPVFIEGPFARPKDHLSKVKR